MASSGAPWNLPTPDLPNVPNAPAQLGDLATTIHNALGRAYPCVSTSMPAPVEGMLAYATDNDTLYISLDGAAWTILWQQPIWIAPTLTNSWVNYGAAYEPAGYMIDAFDVVHLRGLVKSGTTGTAIFTLPVGYRPANSEIFMQVGNTGLARIDITNLGVVMVQNYQGTGGNGFVSLSGITFQQGA